jgi:hypothetical protein
MNDFPYQITEEAKPLATELTKGCSQLEQQVG